MSAVCGWIGLKADIDDDICMVSGTKDGITYDVAYRQDGYLLCMGRRVYLRVTDELRTTVGEASQALKRFHSLSNVNLHHTPGEGWQVMVAIRTTFDIKTAKSKIEMIVNAMHAIQEELDSRGL